MNLTPRAEEVAEIVAILESGDYDGPQDMAKDLLKKAAGLLWMRDWYVLGARGEQHANFGPFASEPEAVKFGNQLAGMVLPQEWGVAKVHGMGRIATNAAGGRDGGGYGYCVTPGCGCPPYAHAQEASARGKCVICKTCDKYQQSAGRKPAMRKPKKEAA